MELLTNLLTKDFVDFGDTENGKTLFSPLHKLGFYALPQKVAGYYVIPSELLSVCPSVCPSAVEHSCPVHNFDTV